MAEKTQNEAAFEPDKQYLSSVYAKALLGATEKAGNTLQVLDEFDAFVTEALDKVPKFAAALESPRVAHAAKEQMLDRAFHGKLSNELCNFLKVVSGHGRMDCIRAIRRAARQLYNEQHGRVAVTLRTADSVDDELLQEIMLRLKSTLGADIDLTAETNPDLIGGAVIQIGDKVYDGSIANRLARMREVVIDRSRQQIRQSTDRFAVSE